MIQQRRLLLFLPPLVVVVLIGCGSNSGSVTGKVTYKDKPLPGGTVTFVTADKKVSTAVIGSDGTYTINKVTAGPVKIAVYPLAPPQPMMEGTKMNPGAMGAPAPEAPPAATDSKSVKLPQQYQDPEKSGLTYTVKSGKQEHNIELK